MVDKLINDGYARASLIAITVIVTKTSIPPLKQTLIFYIVHELLVILNSNLQPCGAKLR